MFDGDVTVTNLKTVPTQTTVAPRVTPPEQQTKCVDCRYRNVDMAEHCDLHTQRREPLKGRILVVSCDGYVYQPSPKPAPAEGEKIA